MVLTRTRTTAIFYRITLFAHTLGTETVLRQDSSPTRILETVHRQNWRQFTDIIEDSSPTKKYCFMGFNEESKLVVLK